MSERETELKRDAHLVVERNPISDEHHGPGEHGRVGFCIGKRVFFVGSFYMPGTTKAEYDEMEQFALEVVEAWNRRAS